jgi:hypothetical protein
MEQDLASHREELSKIHPSDALNHLSYLILELDRLAVLSSQLTDGQDEPEQDTLSCEIKDSRQI